MIFFRGRCSTLSTLCFFFVAGAAFEHVMLFFSWQAQHFEHVMVQNWALVVARCSIVTWCSRKKNYIYIFFKPRAPRYDRGFPCGAVAIFDRNVVSRCGAGCILKPGVRARVAVAILNRNVVFRCGAGCILKLGVCVRVARWSFWIGMWCFVVVRAALKVGVCVCVVR